MDSQNSNKTASRRRGSGGPATTLAFPLGVFLWFVALAIYTAVEGMQTLAIGVAVAGALGIAYSLISNYRWVEQNFFHKRFALGINNLILILAVAGILGLLNLIVFRHNAQYDFTNDRKFSLSDQTLKILAGLKTDVEILAFFIEGSPDDPRGQQANMQRTMLKNLLERYVQASKKITYKLIDPEKEPTLTKQYNITFNGTTVFKNKEKDVRVDPDKMFEYSRSAFNPRLQAFNGEQAVTSALLDLTSGEVRTVVFTEGNGERSIEGEDRGGLAMFKEYLLRDQYRIEKVNLMTSPKIPDNTSVLVMAAPKTNIDPKLLNVVDQWMAGGKSALFLIDSEAPPALRALLKKYGIESSRNLVLDPERFYHPLLGGTAVMPMPELGTHAIVDPMREKKRGCVVPWVSALKAAGDQAEVKGLTYHELLKSSASSWAEMDIEAPKAEFNAGKDIKGPCVLGYAFGKEEPTPPANPMDQTPPPAPKVTNRVVVIGSVEFASNSWAEKAGNIDLVMNAVNWLSGESDRISIRAKSEEAPKLDVEVATYANRILYATMLIIPGFIFGLGAYVWWRRSSL